uniref:1-phosphatidylinositol-5-phosphate 4-kinase n=1 Tax=Schistocephalus solidus TaxID=70667 RepID=A0A0X3PL87_SCHSO
MATQSKQKKLKGGRQKLKLFRANEPLKSVLMWGINHSVNTLQHVKPRAVLLKDDFKAYLKIKVTGHLFNKENMPSRFKFKEYCPLAFQNLRERFGVDINDYWESFTRSQPLWDSVRGKSGSKFLITYNRHYVVKSISSEEVEQMHHFLENYHEYVVNCHGQTLLPQYLGMYRVTVNDQESYLLAMRNVFSPRVTIHKKYDLKAPFGKHELSGFTDFPERGKPGRSLLHACSVLSCASCGGSVVDREANEKERSKPLPTLKDNDFLNDIYKIHIGEVAKERLLQQLNSDMAFLQDNNLMDYSVLVGIHDVEMATELPPEEPPELRDSSHEPSTASAGDGLGELFESHYRLSGPQCTSGVNAMVVGSSGSTTAARPIVGAANASIDEDDDDEEEMKYSDSGPGGNGLLSCSSPTDYDTLTPGTTRQPGNLTPPESPSDFSYRLQPFVGELNPNTEFYGIKGSPNLGRPVIYFIAVIDILTRYGMRKRTAQTYKTVKHGAGSEITTVRPEVYGRRLLDFIGNCIE